MADGAALLARRLQYRCVSRLPLWLRRWCADRRDALANGRGPAVTRLGGRESWHVCLAPLSGDSVVYSGGVGRDVTFELALVARVGCRIELFDPSPTGVETMRRPENQHELIRFHRLGLAGVAGDRRFLPPVDPSEGSFHEGDADDIGAISLPCDDLATVMARLGHARIDLLKLDVEGSEHGIIRQIDELGLPVEQICVEFHPHTWGREADFLASVESWATLERLGYRLIHRERQDHTFMRAPCRR